MQNRQRSFFMAICFKLFNKTFWRTCLLFGFVISALLVSSPAYSFSMSNMGVTLTGQSLEHLLADDSNNVYWIGSNGKFTKYTYATGTWGSLTSMGKVIQSVIYKNGAFHGVYTSGGYIYYTTTTNPASWPTGTALAACSGSSAVMININNQGRYAVLYYSGGVKIASNYSGTNTVNSFSLRTTYSMSQLSNGYNQFQMYNSDDMGSYFYSVYSWNGSAWVESVAQDSYDPEHGIQFGKYDGYIDYRYYGDDPWLYAYESYGSQSYRVDRYSNPTSYRVFGGDSLGSTTSSINGIVKLNAPDGRVMVTGVTSYAGTYAFLPAMNTPSVTITNPAITSLQVNYSSGLNGYGVPILKLATDLGMTNIVSQNSGTAGTNSYSNTFTGIQPSTRYYAQVVLDDGYISLPSSVANLYTLANIPSAVAVSSIGSKSLTISYNANQNGTGTIYQIERSLTGNPAGTDWVTKYTGTNQSFDDSGLDPKTIYYYRIRAQNLNGAWSAYTDVQSVQTADKDTVAPSISLTINNGDNTLMGDSLAVRAVVGDNKTATSLLTYSYSINGSTWTNPVPVGNSTGILDLAISHNQSTSGNMTFQLRVYDEDGNVGIASSKVYYQKPSELPVAPVNETLAISISGSALLSGTVDSQPVYFTRSTSLELDMTTQSQPSYQLCIDNQVYGSVIPKARKMIINLGNEGLHIVTIRQVNAAGIGGTEKEYKIVVDKTAPNVSISFEDSRTITSSSFIIARVSGSDNISTSLMYRVHGGGWNTVPAGGVLNIPLSAGLNTLIVDIGDDAGLYSSQTLKMWRS